MRSGKKSICRCGWPAFLIVAAAALALSGEFISAVCLGIAAAAMLCVGARLGLMFWPFKRRPACYAVAPGECPSRKSARADAPTKAEVARSWAVMF